MCVISTDQIKMSNSFAIIKVSESYIIWCKAKKLLKWTFEGKPISEGQGINIVNSFSMLRVDDVKKEHSGKYECHGTTEQDEPFASMAHLIVVG